MVALRLPLRILFFTAIAAAFTFGLLGLSYTTGSPVNHLDVWLGVLLHDLHDLNITWIALTMTVVSFLGNDGLLLIAGSFLIYFAVCLAWPELLLWCVAVGGAIILNPMLKEYFEVLRPIVGHANLFEENSGFPSGHAMIALVTYGLLAALASAQITTRSTRLAIWGAASVLIFLIGLSRLYMSVHYLSDVVGGYAAGLAWLAACLWVYSVASRYFGSTWSRRLSTDVPDAHVG